MNHRERFVVYSLLGALALSQAIVLLSTGAGNAAYAKARAWFDELGPATSVTIVDEENSSAPEIVLKNKDGKLRFGDSAHTTVFSVGFVHIGKALGQLMDSRSMKDARDRLDEETTAKDEELRNRVVAFQEEHKDVAADDPNIEQIRREYGSLMEEAQRWQMEKAGLREKLVAEQIEQAYRDVVAAVEVVADQEHIDIVYRFIPTDNPFETTSPAAAYDAIRARVAMKYPDGLDLTDKVLDELDLEIE